MSREPSFTLGIEEEYLLIDPVSGNLAAEPPEEDGRLIGKLGSGRQRVVASASGP